MSWTWVDQGKAIYTRVYLHFYRVSNITTTWAICSLMMVITSQVTQPSIVWIAIMIRHRTARKIWFTSNLLSSNIMPKKLNGEWCKVRLSQGQRWQIPHLPMNLQPHVNWYANAIFTIFAFDFFLVSSSLYQVCPEQICVNLIFLAVSYLNL